MQLPDSPAQLLRLVSLWVHGKAWVTAAKTVRLLHIDWLDIAEFPAVKDESVSFFFSSTVWAITTLGKTIALTTEVANPKAIANVEAKSFDRMSIVLWIEK